MFPVALLKRTRLLPGIDPRHYGGPAVLTVEEVVDLLGQMLPCQLTVLGSRAGLLAFDDDACWKVFELDGGGGFVLLLQRRVSASGKAETQTNINQELKKRVSYDLLTTWTAALQVDLCDVLIGWRFGSRRIFDFLVFCCRGE